MTHPLAVVRRNGTITAVTALATATVTIDGSSVPGVPCLQSYTPVVGDNVLVDLVAGSPLVVGAAGAVSRIQYGRTAYALTSAASTTLVVTWPTPFVAAPTVVLHSIEQGGGFDMISNMQSKLPTTGQFRIFTRALTAVTTTGFLNWMARGV
jgi:hypothetical protein